MIIREERIGKQRLILGDCEAVMPMLDKFDLCLTEAPRGFQQAIAVTRTEGGQLFVPDGGDLVTNLAPLRVVEQAIASAQKSIIWGGDLYELPPLFWFVWDRQSFRPRASRCDLAWTNIAEPTHSFNLNSGYRDGLALPVALWQWCLARQPGAVTVLDPFMGEGAALAACVRQGKHGTGIEIDPDAFDAACERVQAAVTA